jgi:hypothetical protein
VIVLLQAWADRYMTLDDWRNDYDDGHYAVLIGYGQAGPSFRGYRVLPPDLLWDYEFVARWLTRYGSSKNQRYERSAWSCWKKSCKANCRAYGLKKKQFVMRVSGQVGSNLES